MKYKKYAKAIASTMDLLRYFPSSIKLRLVFCCLLGVAGAIAESASLALLIPTISIIVNTNIERDNYIGNVFTSYLPVDQVNRIIVILILFISIYLVSVLIRLYNVRYSLSINARVGNFLASSSFEAISNKEYSIYQDLTLEQIHTMLTGGPGGTATYIELILNFISASFISIGIIGLLIWFNPIMTILTFGSLSVIIYLTGASSRKIILDDSRKWPEMNTRKTEFIKEFHNSSKEIFIRSLQNIFVDNFRRVDYPLRISNAKVRYLSIAPRYILEGFTIFFLVIICGYYLTSKSDTSSALIFLSVYVLAIQKLLPQISTIYNSVLKIMSQYAWFSELKKLLDENARKEYVNKPRSLESRITKRFNTSISKGIILSNVSYNWPNSKDLFINLYYELPFGSRVLIVGKSGSGKSTLLDILIGLVPPTSGRIINDGIDIHSSKNTLKLYQDSLSYVPQNIFCFNDTVENNIVFDSSLPIERSKLKYCSEISLLNDNSSKRLLPLDLVVGENGKNLSGGQRQRLSIARALYKEAKLLVMDEPTSAIDHVTSHKIMSNLTENFDGTIVMVSHDQSLIRYFDKVIDLDGFD